MPQNYRILLIFALFQKSRLISKIVIKFDFDKIFSLSYMGKLCQVQNFVLLLLYKDTFIDSYCLLEIYYASFHLSLLWVGNALYITCQSTWNVGKLLTSEYPYGYKYGYRYKVWVYMVFGNTPHSVISIWIETWIWIWSVSLHGVWRYFTFHNIHMDIDVVACLHIITVTYFRYQNRPIENRYHIIYHNSRILNKKSLNFEI